MLNLTLRPDFQGPRPKGTAVELRNSSHTGAIEIPAEKFFEITYPSVDLVRCVENLRPGEGRTVVLMGGRGQGKSHIVAAAHHVLESPGKAKAWLDHWSGQLGNAHLAAIPLRSGFQVITEQLHKQNFENLWDLIFSRVSNGAYFRGKFEQSGTSVPSQQLLLELLNEQPLAILLDEYQTWFDTLADHKQKPRRAWAFNFIQILSEIAAEHPDKLLLLATVRDGNTDAYQQLHRLNPRVINFSDPLTKRDRHRLLLHRIFSNRRQVPASGIQQLIDTHFQAFVELKEIPGPEIAVHRERFLECWPFSPLLLDLLDDQVLMAAQAQETRDLILLLVETFKSAGDTFPVLTAADFRIDTGNSAAPTLLDAVASELHRRIQKKALRNLENVLATHPAQDVPNAAEVISALWLRSFNTERLAGASLADLQLDITRATAIDHNAFEVQITRIKESSYNIHDLGQGNLIFRDEENPDARLLAHARNDRIFQDDDRDLTFLRKFVHSMLAGDEQSPFHIVVLPKFWQTNPWQSMDPDEQPSHWDNRTPLVVVPESPEVENTALGTWLRDNISNRRNTLRFLLPRKGEPSIYFDRDLLVKARAALLAKEWQAENGEYRQLRQSYERKLTDTLKDRFERFAVLDRWNFAEPAKCQFQFAGHGKQGKAIPAAVQTTIETTLFLPEDFESFVTSFAATGESVRKLLDELAEPRPGGQECINWLGEIEFVERLEQMAARGVVAINVRGSQLLQRKPGEGESAALNRMRGKIGTGSHLAQTTLHLPQAAGATGGGTASPTAVPPPVPSSPAPSPQTGSTPGSLPSTIPVAGENGPKPPVPAPGELFGGPEIPAAEPIHRVSVKTSALNLTGELEKWGASGDKPLRNITLRFDDMTAGKLASLLRKLPDGTYVLELDQ